MALAGRVSVFKRTWPWGSGDDDEAKGEALANTKPEPEKAAANLSMWAAMMAGRKPKGGGDGEQ